MFTQFKKITSDSFQHFACWKKPTYYSSEYKMPTKNKVGRSVKRKSKKKK